MKLTAATAIAAGLTLSASAQHHGGSSRPHHRAPSDKKNREYVKEHPKLIAEALRRLPPSKRGELLARMGISSEIRTEEPPKEGADGSTKLSPGASAPTEQQIPGRVPSLPHHGYGGWGGGYTGVALGAVGYLFDHTDQIIHIYELLSGRKKEEVKRELVASGDNSENTKAPDSSRQEKEGDREGAYGSERTPK